MVTVQMNITKPDGVSVSGSKDFINMEDAGEFIKFVSGMCEEKGFDFTYSYARYVDPISRDTLPKWLIRQLQSCDR